MRNVLGQAKDLLRGFLKTVNPMDEAFLCSVTGHLVKGGGFTSDFDTLPGQMVFASARGGTALVDAIYTALRQSRSARLSRRVLLVISDGMDRDSRYKKNKLMAAALESDIQIYSLSIYDPPRNKKPIELTEERNGIALLEELTRVTGGIQIVARDSVEIGQAAASMGRDMRDQYLIGYVPTNADTTGQWHSIKVKVKPPNETAHVRSGFYAK